MLLFFSKNLIPKFDMQIFLTCKYNLVQFNNFQNNSSKCSQTIFFIFSAFWHTHSIIILLIYCLDWSRLKQNYYYTSISSLNILFLPVQIEYSEVWMVNSKNKPMIYPRTINDWPGCNWLPSSFDKYGTGCNVSIRYW